jgi:hypothetical protein
MMIDASRGCIDQPVAECLQVLATHPGRDGDETTLA